MNDTMKRHRSSPKELRRRRSQVFEWLFEDEQSYSDVVRLAVEKWQCSERTAKRYIRAARDWHEGEVASARRSGLLRRRV